MKTKLFTTILATTIALAGILAFMPIEDAKAVHTSIQGSQMNEAGARAAAQFSTDLGGADTITVTSSTDWVAYCTVSEAGVGAGIVTITDGVETEEFEIATGNNGFSFAWAGDSTETLDLSADVAYDGLCTAINLTSGTVVFG